MVIPPRDVVPFYRLRRVRCCPVRLHLLFVTGPGDIVVVVCARRRCYTHRLLPYLVIWLYDCCLTLLLPDDPCDNGDIVEQCIQYLIGVTDLTDRCCLIWRLLFVVPLITSRLTYPTTRCVVVRLLLVMPFVLNISCYYCCWPIVCWCHCGCWYHYCIVVVLLLWWYCSLCWYGTWFWW